MNRDRQQEAGFKTSRQHDRKEWAQGHSEQPQIDAPEHARQHGRAHRTHDLRSAEAERQIRELRGRF